MKTNYQKLFLFATLSFLAVTHSYAGYFLGDLLAALGQAVLVAEQEHEKEIRLREQRAREELQRLRRAHEEERLQFERRRQSSVTFVDSKENIQSRLFDSLEKRLKTITDLDAQSESDKLALWKAKQKIVENAMKQGFSSFSFAEKYALDSLPGGILEVMREKAYSLAKKKEWNEQFLQKVDQEIIKETTEILAQGRSIGHLFKNLENRVEHYRKDFFKPQPAPRPAASLFTPSAPTLAALEEDEHTTIEEIFPKDNSAKTFGEFARQTRDKQIYHAEDCLSCFEKFGTELKKRVTLRCGHQMCPECLYNWIFTKKTQGQVPTCPKCRHPIHETDYNADYISSKL